MNEPNSDRPIPRLPRGFRDSFAGEVKARTAMTAIIREVYERFGFEPLETPALEYVDVLGKYLPDSGTPEGGVFALRDEESNWLALRYDLTAPLSRVVAQHSARLPTPFRRYQIGPVWRMEKPGPGRYREFFQCDFDTVGTASMAADAEVCQVLCEAIEALGVPRGSYQVRVNDRKVLNGVLELVGLSADPEGEACRLRVLRAMDKLDRVGLGGVRDLLARGRLDLSGDFTEGAGLDQRCADRVIGFLKAGDRDRSVVCDRLAGMVAGSAVGEEGVAELRELHGILLGCGLGFDRVVFDPSVVRGLGYYTGPVFEAVLTFEVEDEEGRPRQFGSVAGGGRYDDLVERFTGSKVPATGCCIGVDRLLAALVALGRADVSDPPGPVVVTVMERARMADYMAMAAELRAAGIAAEVYLGSGGFRQQLKYADRRRSPVAVIAGGDEFGRGEVTLKDLRLGAELASRITDRDEWRKGQPAQVSVTRERLVEEVRGMVGGERG